MVHLRLLGPVTLVTGASLFAQSYSYFGSGCPVVPPMLVHRGTPALGTPFRLDVALARPSTIGAVLVGGSRSLWGSIPLPLDLTGLGAPGCLLLASPDLVLGLQTDAAGDATAVFVIPPLPSLLGQSFHDQALIVDPGANALGIATTRGGTGTIARQPALLYMGNQGGAGIIIRGVLHAEGGVARCSAENPIIQGRNVYAPDLVKSGAVWNLYYGGWKNAADVNDRIYFAVSDDALPEGPWAGHVVIVDNGPFIHVNDPSVQRRGVSDWVMAYTVVDAAGDWIAVSTSSDGAAWSPSIATAATRIGLPGADFTAIARPALVWTGSGWKLWFDGRRQSDSALHSYLAESQDLIPRTFTLVHEYSDANGFPGFFEPDVERMNDARGQRYIAVVQRAFSVAHRMESFDGVAFRDLGPILYASDPGFGRQRISNPGLLFDDQGPALLGIAFGMSSPAIVDHDIGFAYLQYDVRVLSCPDTWAVYSQARYLLASYPMTFGLTSFCRIQLVDPLTGLVWLDQAVAGRAGDQWQVVP